jgi:hypothetical protein
MTEQNSGQLEQEAEQIRAGIAHTAEALQDRMSPGKLIDEFMTYMKDSDGTLALDNLGRQARDNPMALAMIGSGFAWLAFGSGPDRAASGRHDTSAYRTNRYPMASAGAYGSQSDADHEGGGLAAAASAVGDAAGGVAARVSGLADRAKDAVAGTADQVRDAATDASDRARRMRHDASDRGHAAADSVRDMADRGRRSMLDALDREPLVLGAIGVAVGAALGAMLPGTRFENEAFGNTREALMRDAEEAVDRAAESARKVGGEALEAAKSASKDEGLIVEGKPVTERLGDVAKAAVSAGEDAVEREADKTGQASASASTSTKPAARPFG